MIGKEWDILVIPNQISLGRHTHLYRLQCPFPLYIGVDYFVLLNTICQVADRHHLVNVC